MKNAFVINSRGEREIFSFQKVYKSAVRAGADKNLAKEIAEIIQSDVFHGMKILELYKVVEFDKLYKVC